MQGFVEQIARELYRKMGDDISSLYIMFPSRRARLFFADALSKVAAKPLWQPHYTSVDEIMCSLSGLSQGEHVRLIVELYKVYSEYHKESFDSFYFWGEMLLADFDAVDKYMIDADILFSNVSDLKQLENDYSYLSEDQIKVISQFWKSFGLESDFSKEKDQFVQIWKTLSTIYHTYRERLETLGIAYSGMIYRSAAEKIKHGESIAILSGSHYVIAGFNALSKSEKIVFDYLQQQYTVDFFWDYDEYYVSNTEQEAGLFIRENIKRYPQKITLPHSNRNFYDSKRITVIDAPSDSLQCKYVGEFLEQVSRNIGCQPDKETAIVLTDENLLLPVLYSIPNSIDDVNITMGYPFRQTLVYSFVERLVELQVRKRLKNNVTSFYHSDVVGILSHPFVMEQQASVAEQIIADITKRQQVFVRLDRLPKDGIIGYILKPMVNWQELSDYLIGVASLILDAKTATGADEMYRTECFSVFGDNVNRLRNSLLECNLDLSMSIYISLLRRLLQSIRIPYEGEPLSGVQVMGILETRNLDFENVLLLSVNDDSFPGNRSSSSFVPYNLRFAYGMPTPAHHEGVYAYYFYRLLQRAQNIQIVYCSRSDDKSSGERSRYIHQLIYESPHKIEQKSIGIDVNLAASQEITVAKHGEVAEKLMAYLGNPDKKLSPTSFYSYLDCPLKFYFRAVARLSKDDEVVEEVDSPMFGLILHRAIQLLYTPLIGKVAPECCVKSLINTKRVNDVVTTAINEIYLSETSQHDVDYSGNVELVRDIVVKYLNKCLLPYDATHSGYTIMALEQSVMAPFEFVNSDGEKAIVYFGGMADRIDRLESGMIRIVDYKTGRVKREFNGLDSLFSDVKEERSSEALQTFIYAMIQSRNGRTAVQPALYYVRAMNDKEYTPLLLDKEKRTEVVSYADYRQEFELKLAKVVSELFDLNIPFRQCSDPKICEWCDYKQICRRK